MQKKHKILAVLMVLTLIGIVGFFVANWQIEKKIKRGLGQLPSHIELSYSELDANVLFGNVALKSSHWKVFGQTTGELVAQGSINNIAIEDFGYWDYLVNDKVSIERLLIQKPVVKYIKNEQVKQADFKQELLGKHTSNFKINQVSLQNADVLVVEKESDSLVFSSPDFNLKVDVLSYNQSKTEPLQFDDFSLDSKNLKYTLNEYDDLLVDSLSITQSSSFLSDVNIKTKFSKQALSQVISKERDHFNIYFKSVEILGQKLEVLREDSLGLKSKLIRVNQPHFEIYRDKLVADDFETKFLYSKMLRDLNFDLAIDMLKINQGDITYSEKVKIENGAGRINFTNFNASIGNLGNAFNPDTETQIEVNTGFMEGSPLKVQWHFKVHDTTDRFVFKADLGHITAASMNSFSEPNLNTRFDGELYQTFFTIDGNPKFSNIDLKIKYDNFKVSMLKEDGREKKKFLSGLINWFISNDSNKNEDGYRYGHAEQVERDKTKSVFNFIWLSIRSGLRSAIANDGEKEN